MSSLKMAGMEKYDPALLGILQNEGQISNFLDIILGFLYRRTDFYMLMKSKTDKLGFPPGIAAKLLLTTYKKYEDLARKADIEKQRNSIVEETENIGDAPVAVEMVEVESEPALPRCSVVEIEDDHNTATPSAGPVLTSTGPTRESADTPSSAAAQSQPATGGQEKDGDTPSYSADSECYNGAVRDTYSWSQTITDCDIRVKVPPSVKKGANVKVTVKKKHVCVRYREAGEEWVTAMDGPLTWDVRSDEVIWSLVPGEHIHINLEKVRERWWEAVLEGEPKINVRKIDASRPYTDLDEEAQAKISEMMYNEQQKRLGLPQSHEQSTQEMLRKAWNAKGSPFAGQPFDPSKVSVDPSGMVNINS